MSPPEYFERTRIEARRRWDSLEADPILAAPWYQLFKQVQSPKHVVSELLQNADDAGATNVTIKVEGNTFVFSHDGEDFTEEHFSSLCRFGYSNKRVLHTIGFRGIGFKSTFSLGNTVQLKTPTLSLHFDRKRFTEPIWDGENTEETNITNIIVEIIDETRRKELLSNIDAWQKNPVSLLFFKSIKQLNIGDRQVYCVDCCAGPVLRSERYLVNDAEMSEIIVFSSDEEYFPEEALAEIKNEKLYERDIEKVIDFPPCKVDIVLGLKGQLFTILPTGVLTDLPFACNAPFIQDPARLKIKDPSISPTNRWLLERIGKLASAAMLGWISNNTLDIKERSKAYALMPDELTSTGTVSDSCHLIVAEAFYTALKNERYILATDGTVVDVDTAFSVPPILYKIWNAKDISQIIQEGYAPLLSGEVKEEYRLKMIRRNWIKEVKKLAILNCLTEVHPNRPSTNEKILTLWLYLLPEITKPWIFSKSIALKVLPVRNQPTLFCLEESIKINKSNSLLSDQDWQFLNRFLNIIDEEWIHYLQSIISENSEKNSFASRERSEQVAIVINTFGLDNSSSTDLLIELVAKKLFDSQLTSHKEYFRLTQIAALLSANVPKGFHYVTKDNLFHSIEECIIQDTSLVEQFIPEKYRNMHTISDRYTSEFISCTPLQWNEWLRSEKSCVRTFPLPIEQYRIEYIKHKLEAEFKNRGYSLPFIYPYGKNRFYIKDFDFNEEFWKFWNNLAKENSNIWAQIMRELLSLPEKILAEHSCSFAFQYHSSNAFKEILAKPAKATWIFKFSELPCLIDNNGQARIPRELYARNQATEALLGIEPFVDKMLDCESNHKFLDMLGVAFTPLSLDGILERLRILTNATDIPKREIENCYRRLDSYIQEASTDDLEKLKNAFETEKLILNNLDEWVNSSGVFLHANDEDAPGAPLIRESVHELALWERLRIPTRPDFEFVIKWLGTLPNNQTLNESDLKRVCSILARHGSRIIEECGSVLNLMGEWVPLDSIQYWISKTSETPFSHLYEGIRRKTADLRSLPEGFILPSGLDSCRSLIEVIENRINPTIESIAEKAIAVPWINTCGGFLERVLLEGLEMVKEENILKLAKRMARTRVAELVTIKSTPYLDGTPVGTPKQMEAVWIDEILCIVMMKDARKAKVLPKEFGNTFQNQEIADAIVYCCDRTEQTIRDYFESNFHLAPVSYNQLVEGQKEANKLQTEDTSFWKKPNLEGNPADFGDVHGKVEDPSSTMEIETSGVVEHHPVHPEHKVIPLIERFATASGFFKVSDQKYKHPDGESIIKNLESRFPWELVDESGNRIKSYYPKECCLRAGSIEIPADVWNLLEEDPIHYSLILIEADRTSFEYTGELLIKLKQKGDITLFPASYTILAKDR